MPAFFSFRPAAFFPPLCLLSPPPWGIPLPFYLFHAILETKRVRTRVYISRVHQDTPQREAFSVWPAGPIPPPPFGIFIPKGYFVKVDLRHVTLAWKRRAHISRCSSLFCCARGHVPCWGPTVVLFPACGLRDSPTLYVPCPYVILAVRKQCLRPPRCVTLHMYLPTRGCLPIVDSILVSGRRLPVIDPQEALCPYSCV